MKATKAINEIDGFGYPLLVITFDQESLPQAKINLNATRWFDRCERGPKPRTPLVFLGSEFAELVPEQEWQVYDSREIMTLRGYTDDPAIVDIVRRWLDDYTDAPGEVPLTADEGTPSE